MKATRFSKWPGWEPPHGYIWAHVGILPLPVLVPVRYFHDPHPKNPR